MPRDYSFVGNNYNNRKYVRATNLSDGEHLYFNSLYSINQHLNINPGIVKMICEGLNYCKTGFSKNDGQRYSFVYITKEELPEKLYKSANKRPRGPRRFKCRPQRQAEASINLPYNSSDMRLKALGGG